MESATLMRCLSRSALLASQTYNRALERTRLINIDETENVNISQNRNLLASSAPSQNDGLDHYSPRCFCGFCSEENANYTPGSIKYRKKPKQKPTMKYDKHRGNSDLCNINLAMKKIQENMDMISFHCECYYDSCPSQNLSHADRRHLRFFHRGVLDSPSPKKCKGKKISSKPKSYQASHLSPKSTGSEDSREDIEQPISEPEASHEPEASEELEKGPSQSSLPALDDKTHSRSFPDRKCIQLQESKVLYHHKKRKLKPSKSKEESVPFRPRTSYSDSSLSDDSSQALIEEIAMQTDSQKHVWFDQGKKNTRKDMSQNALPQSLARQRVKSQTTDFNLRADSYLQGVSAFPTFDKSKPWRSHRKSSEMKCAGVALRLAKEQGIHIVTKPGLYVVRAPDVDSSVCMLSVNPGSLVKLTVE